ENHKAVQALEEQVARINGNAEFLRLLRQAYRGYVKDLLGSGQNQLAEKYRQRLLIIDGTAANDASLRPGASVGKTPAVPAALAGKTIPSATVKDNPPAAPTFRGKVEDPFDLSNKRPLTAPDQRQKHAETLLAQACSEFAQRRYAQARLYFEQAYQTDPASVAQSRDRWAYCKLSYVIDQLNQDRLDVNLLPDLQKEVQTAVSMAPALGDTGKWLLARLDERSRDPGTAPAGQNSERTYTIQHHAAAAESWSLAETTHFRIYHK